jgi:Nif-specific regulatory protein
MPPRTSKLGQIDEASCNVSKELLHLAAHATGSNDFITAGLRCIAQHVNCEHLILVANRDGNWTGLASNGTVGAAMENLPMTLLAEAADSDSAVSSASWLVVPLPRPAGEGQLLAASGFAARPDSHLATFCAAARDFAEGRAVVERLEQAGQRAKQLEAILELAEANRKAERLATVLAAAEQLARRMFGVGCARIFVWDHAHKKLLVPSTNDVLVHASNEEARFARQVMSSRTSFRIDRADIETGHAMLCVPILGRRHRPLGAFQLGDDRLSARDEAMLHELANVVAEAIEHRPRDLTADEQSADRWLLIGESPPIEQLRRLIRRVASTALPVLLIGENGTGKEVVSRLIHAWSDRRDKPFLAVNCAALTETLLESELFGHEKGAFTDAHETRPGKFELAAEGTLFLDEIGELSLGAQARLLRVLEEKVLVRVGGSTPIPTQARVLAATNRDLAALVRGRRFRDDLFFRLNVVTIHIPPLRERGDDLLLLADHFLNQFARQAGFDPPELDRSARQALRRYHWPGNVRELRNLMERLVYLTDTGRFDAAQLGLPDAKPADEVTSLSEATRRFQIAHIEHQIASCRGSMTEAARLLGLHRSNLYRKMRQLGM